METYGWLSSGKLVAPKEDNIQSREHFVERKRALDARRQELSVAVSEAEAREIVEEAGQRKYWEAFRIREYLHLEEYDKQVMASLIESAKVMGRTSWRWSGNLGTFMKRFWVKCGEDMV
mgnify:CR=1 FL=1